MRVRDSHHIIENNLIIEMLYSGTWQGRTERRYTWYAAFEVTDINNVTLTGNHIAGSERAGFWVDGEICGDGASQWSENVAHSTLEGVMSIPPDGFPDCVLYNGFRTWRNLDWGLFSIVAGSIEIEDFISIEDTVGIYPFVPIERIDTFDL